VDTGTTFTLFGQLVILGLIQIGGLGFMTFDTLFALILGKRISLKERLLLKESLNNMSIDGVVRLVKRILMFTVVIELIGGILLAIRFSFDMPLPKAMYYGFFHAISNFNNAGFDLMGDFRSFTGYVDDRLLTLVVCTLITLGGIGFIVMNEVYEYRQTRRFSYKSRVLMSSILVLFGTILIFILEYHNPKTLQPLSAFGKFLASLYQSVTPRRDGSNTLNIPDLTQPTLLFIGASPGSTGGGIKTMTFATLLGAIWSNIKGKEDVIFFSHRILYDTIYKSLTVTVSSLFFGHDDNDASYDHGAP
jgi:trk system potassium uptake protein